MISTKSRIAFRGVPSIIPSSSSSNDVSDEEDDDVVEDVTVEDDKIPEDDSDDELEVLNVVMILSTIHFCEK